jgi:hypothetical protein
MNRFLILVFELFALFILGFLLTFPIAAICNLLPLLFSVLPTIWEMFWRVSLGLMSLSAIAIFFEGIKA